MKPRLRWLLWLVWFTPSRYRPWVGTRVTLALRNAGGRVTEEQRIRSWSFSPATDEVWEIVVLHHTGCGNRPLERWFTALSPTMFLIKIFFHLDVEERVFVKIWPFSLAYPWGSLYLGAAVYDVDTGRMTNPNAGLSRHGCLLFHMFW